jgi:hypothetical protein
MTSIAVSSTPNVGHRSPEDGEWDDENGGDLSTTSTAWNSGSKHRVIGMAPNFIPDDISAIENETVMEPTECHTPEKGKFVVQEESDDATEPETPPKTVPIAPTKSKRSDSQQSARFHRFMMFAACMGCVVLGAIAVLSYSLYKMRNQDGSEAQKTASVWYRDDFQEGPPSDAPVSKAPVTSAPVTSAPVSDAPVAPPVELVGATNLEVVEASILEQTSSFYTGVASLTGDPSSQHYKVLAWLADDPSVMTYSPAKTLQRYALGVVYWSLLGEESTAVEAGSDIWMTYTDECEWPITSKSSTLCDENSMVESMQLEEWNLSGSLASEIGLLTGLNTIFLSNNEIKGELPTTLGLLTALHRLDLRRNKIEGVLPTELGVLKSLGRFIHIIARY